MTEQPSTQNNQPQTKSWREERWERREARRAALGNPGKGVALIAGLLLVLLGIVFLLQSNGNFIIPLNNWGALFIIIPVLALFDRAYREYRTAGNQLTPQSRGAALVGLVLLVVMLVVQFNLNWAIYGPILIILVGLGLLSSTLFSSR
jgi:cobalamin synthase